MNESGCIRFPLAAYPGMNPFVLDWLAGEKRATNFLPREGAPARLPAPHSTELADALDRSNRHWGNFVSDDLRRWAAGETMTLIAGQQVGFAGGPLYTLAKIATLIKMKRQLAAQGKDATIFFWLATEDHDYAEAATLSLPKGNAKSQLDLITLRATRAIESREMVGPAPIPEALIAQLLSLYDIERPPWLREGISFRDSFAELLVLVFEG